MPAPVILGRRPTVRAPALEGVAHAILPSLALWALIGVAVWVA